MQLYLQMSIKLKKCYLNTKTNCYKLFVIYTRGILTKEFIKSSLLLLVLDIRLSLFSKKKLIFISFV